MEHAVTSRAKYLERRILSISKSPRTNHFTCWLHRLYHTTQTPTRISPLPRRTCTSRKPLGQWTRGNQVLPLANCWRQNSRLASNRGILLRVTLQPCSSQYNGFIVNAQSDTAFPALPSNILFSHLTISK
ncbi:hypothetical protein K491DRAFT_241892 [Lophiostoma macrostomum CBS 122681]|uniref:Uncharacterized protein n=1 Tax=Lophiostoma macrostomum CBS 122681 TaxID=1314788 RepID=A0A6A6SNH3_9PLEO|nr:hypothetical protein K491DRAFT_241892 [Lophiostoma macrostomum CBS 122681]